MASGSLFTIIPPLFAPKVAGTLVCRNRFSIGLLGKHGASNAVRPKAEPERRCSILASHHF